MDPETAFARMLEAFAAAESAHPDRVSEAWYTLAGRAVRLRVVGRELARVVQWPFAHLRAGGADLPAPDLTICLWDQRETGVPCEARPALLGDAAPSRIAASPDGRWVTHALEQSASCLDRAARRIVGCVPAASALSLYERGRPLHVPLAVWHNDRDVPVIHAGCVSWNGQGVLLAGPAGAGKSTAAVACLCAGFGYLSDDLVGLEALGDGSFVGHSLYGSTALEPHQLERFPPLAPRASRSLYAREDKALVLLSEVYPLRLQRAARVGAVALTRVAGGRRSRLRPAAKGESLLALAPSSLLTGPTSPGARGFQRLAQLVESVPCFWLELGADLEDIPARVRELLPPAAAPGDGETRV